MPTPEAQLLFHQPIPDHAFSQDRQLLAVARGSKVLLYSRAGNEYAKQDQELDINKQTITSVDIAPNSGRIVTCSQDRNPYVWEQQPTGEWKASLVLAGLKRAGTQIRWSPDETRIAVGCGSGAIAICYFDEGNNTWLGKHVLTKQTYSTVLSLAWHPNSKILASGYADSKTRVHSALARGFDKARVKKLEEIITEWGNYEVSTKESGGSPVYTKNNTVFAEFTNPSGGWVHAVSFSPSGEALAYAAHDSSITVVYAHKSLREEAGQTVADFSYSRFTVSTTLLPFTSLLWSREDQIIAAGHDCYPVIFQNSGEGWALTSKLNALQLAGTGGEEAEESAFNKFRQMDSMGTTSKDVLGTIHQNTICSLRPYEMGPHGDVVRFSSSGRDGRLVIFPVA
ncbi:ARP2/3 actin-organizing complex subunit Sop2 [Pyronema domesticum]|uniref:Arp2/3 complex 41 kDa subunit n=1 Tax=Pyronema omphalodes (strain CBS 100304) TaxID=1076935 RepID=U4LBS7_PYROM|nr:ARP2/3 actin-organizing complex subunit Sop2 [Pyronema domesticum]CCX29564.1 Similar to Actin-related protein 2/3 complex subunit 1; acc. no. P78774 [Pyronema omphalodes CBS 100304]